MNTRVAATLCCVLALGVLPGATAFGNEARLVVGGESSVAVCQVAVYVRAVIILGFEDSLGLAAKPADQSFATAMASADPVGTYAARCDILLGTIRIVVPSGQAARAASHVSGPPAVASSAAFGNSVEATFAPGGAAATCQHLLLIDSVIITGSAYGLPTGSSGGPLLVPPTGGTAGCRTAIGEIEIVEND